jgi:hypothetical protein
MKRSQIVMLFAGGAALAGAYAYIEHQNCQPNATGTTPSNCSSSSHGGSSGSSHSDSSSSNSVSHGGFGATGAAHGGGS